MNALITPSPRRLSGLQKQVLSLYRTCLRACCKLPIGESRLKAVSYVRLEFRANASSVKTLDLQRIDHLLRQAKKKLKLYSGNTISGFDAAVSQEEETNLGVRTSKAIAGMLK